MAMAHRGEDIIINDGCSRGPAFYFYYLISNSESELKTENASGGKGIKFLKPFPIQYVFFGAEKS